MVMNLTSHQPEESSTSVIQYRLFPNKGTRVGRMHGIAQTRHHHYENTIALNVLYPNIIKVILSCRDKHNTSAFALVGSFSHNVREYRT